MFEEMSKNELMLTDGGLWKQVVKVVAESLVVEVVISAGNALVEYLEEKPREKYTGEILTPTPSVPEHSY